VKVEDAAACVAYLTSMTSGWNDDATEMLVYEFEKLDDPAALELATAKIARTWTSQGRVPLGVIVDAYHHEQAIALNATREAQAAEERCDGWGWIDGDPCAVCSPALRLVYADPALLRRFRDGVALHKILDWPDRKTFEAEYNRERCPQRFVAESTTTRPIPTINNEVF